jgi:hypothetical protein
MKPINVKFCLYILIHHTMKAHKVEVVLYAYYTWILNGMPETNFMCQLSWGETSHFTHEVGGWVGPTTGMDALGERKYLLSLELNSFSLSIQASFVM